MALRGQGKRSGKGRSYERILELKSMVDRIINDCSIESKEVREGLRAIKDYQLDVLGEIRDLPEDDDDRTYYGRAERETYEPYSRAQEREYEVAPYSDPRTASELTNLREEKINLMNELNGEIRNGNKLAQNYKHLETEYQRLRKEMERLKPGKYEESSNQGESIINKVNQAARVLDEGPRPQRYASEHRYEQPPRRYEESRPEPRPPRITQSLQSENARLKEQLSQAYRQIDRLAAINQDLERKLRSSEQQISRLERDLNRRSPARQGGASSDVLAQLEQLKRQNEELRVETIRLLKAKDAQGGDAAELQEQIIRLHSEIEKENQNKRQFIQDVEKYKRKFASIEQENKQLKARVEELSRAGGSSFNYTSYAAAGGDYQPSRAGPIYNQMAGVIGESKADKYRSYLNELQSSSGGTANFGY